MPRNARSEILPKIGKIDRRAKTLKVRGSLTKLVLVGTPPPVRMARFLAAFSYHVVRLGLSSVPRDARGVVLCKMARNDARAETLKVRGSDLAQLLQYAPPVHMAGVSGGVLLSHGRVGIVKPAQRREWRGSVQNARKWLESENPKKTLKVKRPSSTSGVRSSRGR